MKKEIEVIALSDQRRGAPEAQTALPRNSTECEKTGRNGVGKKK